MNNRSKWWNCPKVQRAFQKYSLTLFVLIPADHNFLLRRYIAFFLVSVLVSWQAENYSRIGWKGQTRSVKICCTMFFTVNGILRVHIQTVLSHECMLCINVIVNNQIVRNSRADCPDGHSLEAMNSSAITTWCAMSKERIKWPKLFENEKITGERYLDILIHYA